MSGPEWWPISAIVTVVTAFIGVALGLIVCWVGNRRSKPLKGYFAVVPAATGSMVGAALAWYSRRNPPEIFVRLVSSASFNDYGTTGLPREDIYGAPPLYDAMNASILLPAAGAAAGVITVGAAAAVRRVLFWLEKCCKQRA